MSNSISSIKPGSSSPSRVRLTLPDTGHMRSAPSGAAFKVSVPAVPFSQASTWCGCRSTGMRSWIARVSALASVTMIVQERTGSPVSMSFH
jgi:hypothetical protein